MDAIFSIPPQSPSANSAGGSTAPNSVDDGAFAALLAGQTAPVTPVPAVMPRASGGNAFAPTSTSATGSVPAALANLSAVTSGASTMTGTPIPSTNTASASVPTSPTTGANLDINGAAQPLAAATGANTPVNQGSSTPPIIGDQAAVMPVKPTPASPVGIDAKGATSTTAEATTQSAFSTANSKGVSATPIKNNVTTGSNDTANNAAKASATGSEATKTNAATTQSAASNLAPSNSQTPTAQAATSATTMAAAVPQPQAQAGVQARRDAAGSAQTTISGSTLTIKTGTDKAPTSGVSTPASTGRPQISVQALPSSSPQTQMPPSETPIDPARLAAGEAGRHTPAPLDNTQADPAIDGERLDMSNLRAAEVSRTSERPGTAAGTARFTPANAGSLAAQIAAKFQNGERKFEIRMDPPELGRIQVKMQVSNDNRVHAILSAERPETLNDMRQHARELERALEESGLQLDNDGLSFELSQGSEEQNDGSYGTNGFSNIEFAEDLSGPITAAALPRELYGFHLATLSSVDVRL